MSIFRTRCSSPVLHAVIWDHLTKSCTIQKTGWRNVTLDLNMIFDFEELLRYDIFIYFKIIVIIYNYISDYISFIKINRLEYDPARGLHENCKTPQKPDHLLRSYLVKRDKNDHSDISNGGDEVTIVKQ